MLAYDSSALRAVGCEHEREVHAQRPGKARGHVVTCFHGKGNVAMLGRARGASPPVRRTRTPRWRSGDGWREERRIGERRNALSRGRRQVLGSFGRLAKRFRTWRLGPRRWRIHD